MAMDKGLYAAPMGIGEDQAEPIEIEIEGVGVLSNPIADE